MCVASTPWNQYRKNITCDDPGILLKSQYQMTNHILRKIPMHKEASRNDAEGKTDDPKY